ncbi:hypothetical protein [Hymenobacter cellulosilyticus]|uniref:Uncharacterized protein n=1 Tax=Hymenobacter cellulosilyticus TaxID=2932248 RepID=A0A8T9Q5C8_9BACT|nr:hypothetical protein [Hymenobacter cellulosilyticus]UOQ72876.1 hypothetical protein MUN79_02485 [Hymenobacter cellulosilyticus]
MLRTPTSFSEGTAAYVRRHFALSQVELGRWLGVNSAQVQAVEAGRRNFSPQAEARLRRLSDLLPPRGPALPAPEALPPLPPRGARTAKEAREAELLRRRVRRCEHLARQLAFQLETLALQDEALLRRRQGVAALRLALATPPLTPDPTTTRPRKKPGWPASRPMWRPCPAAGAAGAGPPGAAPPALAR